MRWLLLCLALLCPAAALAQAEDDGTVLSRFLEDQLSDDGNRQVTIQGFRGALSSEATLDRLTISDADGPWLILENAVLDWTRSALFRGTLDVEQLTAERLEILRPPLPAEGIDLPEAEAQPFALPDLPVRIEIGRVAIDEVVLGEPVLGLPAQLSVEGSAVLAGGAGEADIRLDRLDGPRGAFILSGAYDNAERDLTVSILLDEDRDGLAAELLNIPDRPALRLSVEGSGPIDAFTADITLASDGVERIAGVIETGTENGGDGTIAANIGGDIRPLMLPEYRAFFGDDVRLITQIRQPEEGGTVLEGLTLRSAALNLEGALALDAQNLPSAIDLTATIVPPEGDQVRLPSGGANAQVAGASLALTYDRTEGEGYGLVAELSDLSVDDLRVPQVDLQVQGIVAITDAGVEAATGDLSLAMSELAHADPDLARALGPDLSLDAMLSWVNGAPLILSDLALTSGDVTASGGASARTTETEIAVQLDLLASVGDLERFATLAGQPLDGALSATLSGGMTPLSGAFDLTLAGTGRDLRFVEAIPEEIFAGQTDLSLRAIRDETGLQVRDLRLDNAELSLTGQAAASSGDSELSALFTLNDLSRFTELLSGPVTVEADIARTGTDPFDIDLALRGPNDIVADVTGAFDAETQGFTLAVAGSARDLDLGDAVPRALLAGRTEVSAQVSRTGETITLSNVSLSNAEVTATANASLSPRDTELSADIALSDVGLFTDLLTGPVTLTADASRAGTDPFNVSVALRGPNEIAADVAGAVNAETMEFNLALAASAVDLRLGDAVPAGLLAGRTEMSAQIAREGEVMTLTGLSLGNAELTATGNARVAPDESRIALDARLRNVGLFTDALSGPVTADATLTRVGDAPWQVDADLGGPGGMRADVAGQVGLPDGGVDLTARGSAPLALANRYIRPRSIRGTLNFDLAMRGQPGLGSLSGSFNTSAARVAVPTYRLAIEDVGGSGQISGGRVDFSLNGRLSSGGQLATRGNINLASAGLPGQIDITLNDARLVDPTLYEARISSAALNVSGPMARRPQISGQVTLGETEIRVPEASLAGSAAIPDIRFVGEGREARLTRGFAGLLGRNSGGGGGGSNTTGLDITINAPGRIFLRGRGIDAEFGGSIRLFGTTANVIPTGQFELIRGRLSILGTRLDFVEGQATLQGSFDPFLRLAATSRASGYVITIRVDGPASSPEITFSSDPSLPEDEVLAQLLFGRSVSGLSPLQLLQLADAATSLAGGSTNSGLIAGLRDGLGLDDLDLSTDEEGNAAVTAGRYLSENIYTDVTVNAEGDADLSLNIDLTPNITARGSVGSDGGSSIGIFFEQDY